MAGGLLLVLAIAGCGAIDEPARLQSAQYARACDRMLKLAKTADDSLDVLRDHLGGGGGRWTRTFGTCAEFLAADTLPPGAR